MEPQVKTLNTQASVTFPRCCSVFVVCHPSILGEVHCPNSTVGTGGGYFPRLPLMDLLPCWCCSVSFPAINFTRSVTAFSEFLWVMLADYWTWRWSQYLPSLALGINLGKSWGLLLWFLRCLILAEPLLSLFFQSLSLIYCLVFFKASFSFPLLANYIMKLNFFKCG